MLVHETSAGELSCKAMAKGLFEAALMMVVAAGARIILSSHINQNIHFLPYCRITAAYRTQLSAHTPHCMQGRPHAASVNRIQCSPSSIYRTASQTTDDVAQDVDLREHAPPCNSTIGELLRLGE